MTDKPELNEAWAEAEDWLAMVIDDSIDMDWTVRDGARAIVQCLKNGEGEELRSVLTRTPSDGLVEALALAKLHLTHQAAWIGKQNAGYSFEALGEDMPTIDAALTRAKGGA